MVLGATERDKVGSLGRSGLSDSALKAAQNIIGPVKGVMNMLVQVKDISPLLEEPVKLVMNAEAMWALSTTDLDAKFRDRLSDWIGFKDAIRVLAEKYPTGTAALSIEMAARDMARNDPNIRASDVLGDVVTDLVFQMVAAAG